MAGIKSLLHSAKAPTAVSGIGSPYLFYQPKYIAKFSIVLGFPQGRMATKALKVTKHFVIDRKASLHHYLEGDFAV